MDPGDLSDPGTDRKEEDDHEIMFTSRIQKAEKPLSTPERAQATTDCEIINVVKTLNGAIAAVSQDMARIQRAYDQLRTENMARDKALANLSAMVKEYGSSPVTMRPHPVIQADVLDEEGNLRAADIGITWEDNETFLHGVRVVGPGPLRPTGMGPVMSTPYQPMREHDRDNTSTTALPPTPRTPVTVPDADILGTFQFRVMPFGLCNASATFERLMDQVLQGLRWSRCLVYLDDIISFGTTFEDALDNLTLIFERLRTYGLQLKSSRLRCPS